MATARPKTKAASRTPLNLRLAAHVRRLRLAAGMTQEQLAEAAGLGGRQKAVSLIEGGRVKPDQETIEALADAFGVDPVELLAEPTSSELAASA